MENLTRVLIPSSSPESPSSTYDDNKDIIWPTVVGIFVALALGWMICRYKCSSKERSPHIVQCCPKTLCKNIRLCCTYVCRMSCEQEPSMPESRTSTNKPRSSNNSIQEIPFIKRNSSITRSSIAQISEQWPPPFLLNQSPTFPVSIAAQPTVTSPQPKRHPLRRESTLAGYNNERRESTLWPFRTINAVFHKQTSEIKPNDIFYTA